MKPKIQEVINKRDKQIMEWYKLPIKNDLRLGPVMCDVCGGGLYQVRPRHPAHDHRMICPTCAIEILEGIYQNLYPNNQANECSPNQ